MMLILSASYFLKADQDTGEVYTCSFSAHTPVGTLTGDCTTQSLQDANSISRWKMTLTFDQASSALASNLKAESFYDLVRTQCIADGSFTTVMPLWGDLVIKPDDPDYVAGNIACAPAAQTVPNLIAISVTNASPLTLAFLFDQRRADFNVTLGVPSYEWLMHYWESFRWLSGNPPVGLK